LNSAVFYLNLNFINTYDAWRAFPLRLCIVEPRFEVSTFTSGAEHLTGW